MPRAQIKDEKQHQKLREQGESREKAARIANASADCAAHIRAVRAVMGRGG